MDIHLVIKDEAKGKALVDFLRSLDFVSVLQEDDEEIVSTTEHWIPRL